MASPEWVEPMLATLSDERDLSDDWWLERKLDGIRCLGIVQDGSAVLRSRNRLPLAFPGVAAALAPLRDAIVDGEVVAVGEDGEPLGFQALQRHGSAALWAFDLLWLDGEDLRERPLRERHAALAAAVRPGPALQVSGPVAGPSREAYRRACAAGWEGLIAKRADAPYRGGRSRDWLKLKCVLEQEVVVGGFTEPQGARVGLGALLVGYHEAGALRYAGKSAPGSTRPRWSRCASGSSRSRRRPRPSTTRSSRAPRAPTGSAPSSSPRLASPSGPRRAGCASRASSGCARTRRPVRSCASDPPDLPRAAHRKGVACPGGAVRTAPPWDRSNRLTDGSDRQRIDWSLSGRRPCRPRVRGGRPGKPDRIASPLTSTATQDRAGARSRASTVRLVVVLGAVNAIGPLSIDMYLPAFPELARGLHTSASQVQLTLTACVAGLALGQLVVGPLSDRLGRRVPLIAAMTVYALASVCCALAPSAPVLMGLRLVQGLAGAGGVVIARAVVRDLHTGAAAVRLFSSLMLVTGLAPILAPLAGGQVLSVTSWRGIFLVLAGLSALFAVLVAVGLRETLPPERRSHRGLRRTLQTMRALLRDRWFVGHALAGGLGFGALFAYISGSSFVLQGIYGVSPQLYSVLFAMNGLGLIAGSQVNARAVGRFGPARLLRGGLLTIAASSGTLLAVALAGGLGVWAVLVPMFVIVSSLSFVLPNSTALALADHAAVAGTASALLGVGQFLIGAAVAPLVGAGGTQSAVPMAAVMTGVALAALVARRAAGARRRVAR